MEWRKGYDGVKRRDGWGKKKRGFLSKLPNNTMQLTLAASIKRKDKAMMAPETESRSMERASAAFFRVAFLEPTPRASRACLQNSDTYSREGSLDKRPKSWVRRSPRVMRGIYLQRIEIYFFN